MELGDTDAKRRLMTLVERHSRAGGFRGPHLKPETAFRLERDPRIIASHLLLCLGTSE